MNKHLESEWTLGDENNSHYEVIVGDSGMTIDLDRFDKWTGAAVMSRQEMIEVGHLIMAAPKMLKMLKMLKNLSREVAFMNLSDDKKEQIHKLIYEFMGER